MEVLCRKLIRCRKCINIRNSVRRFCDKNRDGTKEAAEEWPRHIVSGLQPTGELHVGNYFGAVRRCARLIQQGEDVTIFIADLHSLTTHHNRDGTKEAAEEWPRHIVSGLQPTGELHVGNYFGAVRRCARLIQQGEDVTIFIADLHSLTTHHDAGLLRRRSLELAAQLVAAGADPARCTLFVQSAVPRHAELCWALACAASLARLHHLPQFRAKAGPDAPAGLLLYPVLQAADVLLHRATHALVGRDQAQHLQLAAMLARTFNHRYGRAFPAPRALLPDDGSDRILSLRDPSKKMSKSDPDPKSRILLSDPDDVIERKIRKAVTDFTPQVTYSPETRPGVSNLVALHCLAADMLPEEAVAEAEGLTTAQYKRVVAGALVGAVAPVRERARGLLARPHLLHDALRHGAAAARRRADAAWDHAAHLMGLATAAGAPAAAPAPPPRPTAAPAPQRSTLPFINRT